MFSVRTVPNALQKPGRSGRSPSVPHWLANPPRYSLWSVTAAKSRGRASFTSTHAWSAMSHGKPTAWPFAKRYASRGPFSVL